MRIVCPQCGYSRDIPEDKIPTRSSVASCPKCQFRFRFRGHSPHPHEDASPQEPAYPPRPSRTPSAVQAPTPFEPSQRLYGAPGEARHFSPEPPRPRARWVPDPEPEAFQTPPSQPPASASGRPRRPERPASPPEPFGSDARETDAQIPYPSSATREPLAGISSREESQRAERERLSPSDYGLDPEAYGRSFPTGRDLPPPDRETSHPMPGFDPRHPPRASARRVQEDASADDFPAQDLAADRNGEPLQSSWAGGGSRMRMGEDSPLPAPSRPAQEDAPVPPEFAMPEPGRAAARQAEASGEQWPGEVQPSEALAGNESVRDIWSRLQAMGGEPAGTPGGQYAGDGAPSAPQSNRPITDTVAPWEQLELYGVVPAFLNTSRAILVKPGDFFEQLPPFAGKVRPILYAVAVCLIAVLSGIVWNFFGLGPNFSELGRTEMFQGLGAGALGRLAWLGLSPLVVAAFVFVNAGLTHLLLGLLRSATRPFEETFRAICYAGGPWLLAALPVPYSYLIPVVLIWHMTLEAIGLKKLHGAGYPQVLASVLVKWSLFFMASFSILHVLITRR